MERRIFPRRLIKWRTRQLENGAEHLQKEGDNGNMIPIWKYQNSSAERKAWPKLRDYQIRRIANANTARKTTTMGGMGRAAI